MSYARWGAVVAALAIGVSLLIWWAVDPASSLAATSKTQSYTCGYKLTSGQLTAYVSMGGGVVTQAFCQPLLRGMSGRGYHYVRFYGRLPGRQYGAWRNDTIGATFRVNATNEFVGRYLSTFMGNHPMGGGWYRIA